VAAVVTNGSTESSSPWVAHQKVQGMSYSQFYPLDLLLVDPASLSPLSKKNLCNGSVALRALNGTLPPLLAGGEPTSVCGLVEFFLFPFKVY
jgi:hypothetical protein